MKHILFGLFGVFLTSGLTAQDTNSILGESMPASVDLIEIADVNDTVAKKNRHLPFQLGIYLAPGLNSFDVIGFDPNYDNFQSNLKFGFSGGLLAEYPIRKNLWVESGVFFGRRNFGLTIEDFPVQVSSGNETTYIDSKESIHTYGFNDIGLPLSLKYMLLDQKIALEAGCAVHYLFGGSATSKHTFETGPEQEQTLTVNNRIFYSARFAVSYRYDLSEKLLMVCSPNVLLMSGAQGFSWQDIKMNVYGLRIGLILNNDKAGSKKVF